LKETKDALDEKISDLPGGSISNSHSHSVVDQTGPLGSDDVDENDEYDEPEPSSQ